MDSFLANSTNIQNASAEILRFVETCGASVTSNRTDDCSDLNNGTSTSPGDFFDALWVALTVVFNCLDVICVLNNILMVVVIYLTTKLKDIASKFLTNNAVADGCFGLVFLILMVCSLSTTDTYIIETVLTLCRMTTFLLFAESLQTLAMTLFTLHLAICNPIRYRIYCKSKYFVIFLLVSWSMNIISWIPACLVDGMFGTEEYSGLPTTFVRTENAWFAVLVAILGLVVPLTSIIISYIRISRYIRSSQNLRIISQSTTKAHIQKARGVFVVSIIFVMTSIPVFVFELFGNKSAKVFGLSEDSLSVIRNVTELMMYTYTTFKFFIFLLAFKNYRQVVWKCCCRCRSRQGAVQHEARGNPKAGSSQAEDELTTDGQKRSMTWTSTDQGRVSCGTISDGYVGSPSDYNAVKQTTNTETIAEDGQKRSMTWTSTDQGRVSCGTINDGYVGSPSDYNAVKQTTNTETIAEDGQKRSMTWTSTDQGRVSCGTINDGYVGSPSDYNAVKQTTNTETIAEGFSSGSVEYTEGGDNRV